MTLPQDGTPLRNSVIEYFTRFKDDILQRAKSTSYEDLTVFDLLSFMGNKGYENGIGKMSAKERMAGYENGIGKMSAEERTARNIKGGRNKRSTRIAWTVDLDDAIVRMIGDSFSYGNIASELGNGQTKNDIAHRWQRHLKKSSNIIKPHTLAGAWAGGTEYGVNFVLLIKIVCLVLCVT
jgi:hypothetical protein